jgi:hypothetical protein
VHGGIVVTTRSQSSFNLSSQDVREGAWRCGGDLDSSSLCRHCLSSLGHEGAWVPKHILIDYVVVQSERKTVRGGDPSSSSSCRLSIGNITTQKRSWLLFYVIHKGGNNARAVCNHHREFVIQGSSLPTLS